MIFFFSWFLLGILAECIRLSLWVRHHIWPSIVDRIKHLNIMNWHNFAKFVLDKHLAIIRPRIDNIFTLFHFASLKKAISRLAVRSSLVQMFFCPSKTLIAWRTSRSMGSGLYLLSLSSSSSSSSFPPSVVIGAVESRLMAECSVVSSASAPDEFPFEAAATSEVGVFHGASGSCWFFGLSLTRAA